MWLSRMQVQGHIGSEHLSPIIEGLNFWDKQRQGIWCWIITDAKTSWCSLVTSCLRNPPDSLASFARFFLTGNNQSVLHLTLDEGFWGRSWGAEVFFSLSYLYLHAFPRHWEPEDWSRICRSMTLILMQARDDMENQPHREIALIQTRSCYLSHKLQARLNAIIHRNPRIIKESGLASN